LKLAIWSPLPPAPSGIADYVAETLPALARGADIEIVCTDPGAVDPDLRARFRICAPGEETPPDVDVYHLGNSPAHAFVYRAAVARPGVAVMHDWSLHYALLGIAVTSGDAEPYLSEMRLAYRERGDFIGRQMVKALGGDAWASLFPLNERLLESSLAVVSLSRTTAQRARRALPGRPVLHLPLHAAPVDPRPTRAEARRALGIPEDALVVTAPGLATAHKGLHAAVRAVGRLAHRFPSLRLVVAGEADRSAPVPLWAAEAGISSRVFLTGRLEFDDFIRHLVAADVVLALRFPSFGEMSATLVRAMGLARAVLVTAGTPPADEMPEGTVVPIDPGPHQETDLVALLGRLLAEPRLRETVGELAQEHVRATHALPATVTRLLGFLKEVVARGPELRAAAAASRAEVGTLLGYFKEEIRWCAQGLGLVDWPAAVEERIAELVAKRLEASL
jgi:glycosyltransferase involved in cell wall biosynthesis